MFMCWRIVKVRDTTSANVRRTEDGKEAELPPLFGVCSRSFMIASLETRGLSWLVNCLGSDIV